MNKKKGFFVTFEGPEGCGKTTIIKKLHDFLINKKFSVVLTREPGGKNNLIAEDIRRIILDHLEYQINHKAEVLLFAASRAQHVSDFIKPELNKGHVVLCDRYLHSSLVYQGFARDIGIDDVYQVNQFAIDHILPDLTFVLMINPEEGLNRIKSNPNRDVNRLDQEKIELHQKVYQGYQWIIKNKPLNKIIEIDASKSVDEVFENVLNYFLKEYNEFYAK